MSGGNRLRRVTKEIEETTKDKDAGVILMPARGGSDLTHLEGQFTGPPDTPYEGGKYHIDITIPNDYPFRPPVMKFTTRIWHPNVSSQTGAICLDTLSTAWSPVLTLKAALQSIQGLLASPEPKDPQDAEVAGMLIKNPDEFARVARIWAQKYAEAPVKEGQPVVIDLEKEQEEEDMNKKRLQYHGYHEAVVGRFCEMGFDIPTVVSALESCQVDKNGGQNYRPSDDRMNDVMSRLIGDA